MSGWGTPGWLRMNPPVSRWDVAPSPEDEKTMRQKSKSGRGRCASLLFLACILVPGPKSSTLSSFPNVGSPNTMAFDISSVPRGFSFAPSPDSTTANWTVGPDVPMGTPNLLQPALHTQAVIKAKALFHPTSHCCRKGNPFQGPRVGSSLTLGNELSEEAHVLTKQKTLLGRGALGREQEGKGTQEHCSAMWLTVSGFTVMGLVSRLSLAKHLAWPIV